MSQMSHLSQGVAVVTAVTGVCHKKVTDVTAVLRQVIENKESGSNSTELGCDSLYIKNVRIKEKEMARPRGLAHCAGPSRAERFRLLVEATLRAFEPLGRRVERADIVRKDRSKQ